MKKGIIGVVLLGVCFFGGADIGFTENYCPEDGSPCYDVKPLDDVSPGEAGASPTTVTVTEKIPGMDCGENIGTQDDVEHKKYKCTIQPGFGSVMLILKGLIKYATFITALIGALMLVYSGIEYSISGASGGDVKSAKGRITKIIAGLVLLFLIGFILNSVAPWIYG